MISILVRDPVPGMAPGPCACDVPHALSLDPVNLDAADAVIFHIPSLRPERPRKCPGQVWVAWSMECEAWYPQQADPAFLRAFDLRMTYRRDADVWVPYLEQDWDRLRAPVPARTELAPAVAFVSNATDRSGRGHYLRELLRHLPVDVYGGAAPNRRLARDEGRPTKLQTIARYRFTLAFENAVAPDYVTEKLYDPLVAGSVPVYLGAPNVDDFLPGEGCAVLTRDHASPRELAAYLRALCADEPAYRAHLAWKERPLRPSFTAMLEATRTPAFCRLARKVQELRRR